MTGGCCTIGRGPCFLSLALLQHLVVLDGVLKRSAVKKCAHSCKALYDALLHTLAGIVESAYIVTT